MTKIPDGLTGKSLFEWLKTNKSILEAEKKYDVKKGDAIFGANLSVNDAGELVKSAPVETGGKLKVTSIINSCNWMDSHQDVHISGLWDKSLNEAKILYLLEEHKMSFRGIISDEVKAFTKKISWRELGVNIAGKTECLVFESIVSPDRNSYMYEEYRKGHVKNHSVGMRYVNLQMAINDDDEYYKDEFALWNKYFDQIANKEQAEETGYFWAVREAKVVEGSAVPIGSNIITPTQNVESTGKNQPPAGTEETAGANAFNVMEAIKSITIKL